MMYSIGALVMLALAAVIVALVYKGQAAAERHAAEMQRQRAEALAATVHQRQQLDVALTSLSETHRKETIHASTPTHLAQRADFTTDWEPAPGLYDPTTITHPLTGATVADASGAADDHGGRVDLSE